MLKGYFNLSAFIRALLIMLFMVLYRYVSLILGEATGEERKDGRKFASKSRIEQAQINSMYADAFVYN